MSALVIDRLPAAQRNYDRQLPDDRGALYDAAEEAEHELRPATEVTEQEVEEMIARIADTGTYEDEVGNVKQAGNVYCALALDWIHHRTKLTGCTYIAFYQWAESIAAIAKYGK